MVGSVQCSGSKSEEETVTEEERKRVAAWGADLFGWEKSLPDICLGIRAGLDGSADPVEVRVTIRHRNWLEAKIAAWQPSSDDGPSAAMDAAVLALAKATVAYVDWWFSEAAE